MLKITKMGYMVAVAMLVPHVVQAYTFTRSLQKGSSGAEVVELQKILKTDSSIYPEGIVSGYFGTLTEKAVQRFQAKYGIVNKGDPVSTGYGFIGKRTRAKLNEVFGSGKAAPVVGNIPPSTITAPVLANPSAAPNKKLDIQITYPDRHTTLYVGRTQSIEWNVGESVTDIADVKILIKGSTESITIAEKVPLKNNNTRVGFYNWTIPSLSKLPFSSNGEYTVVIQMNNSVAYSDAFKIINPVAVVFQKPPEGGEVFVAGSVAWAISWNVPAGIDDATRATVYLKGGSSLYPIAKDILLKQRQVTLEFPQDMSHYPKAGLNGYSIVLSFDNQTVEGPHFSIIAPSNTSRSSSMSINGLRDGGLVCGLYPVYASFDAKMDLESKTARLFFINEVSKEEIFVKNIDLSNVGAPGWGGSGNIPGVKLNPGIYRVKISREIGGQTETVISNAPFAIFPGGSYYCR
ncbi:MAG: peptidoglycan-binding domain-containing protein [Patescibacteria group bacterium]